MAFIFWWMIGSLTTSQNCKKKRKKKKKDQLAASLFIYLSIKKGEFLQKYTLVGKKKPLPKLSQIFVGRKTKLIKLSIKSGKDGTGTPLFGHTGDEILKNRRKNYTGLQGGHETQVSSKLDAKLSLPSPFFS
jgi:hypothetical protein